MRNKIQIVKIKLINFVTQLYLGNSTNIVTISWIAASIHLTMIYNFQDCISNYDEKKLFFIIFWLSLITIFIIYISIILYFFINRDKIGKEKDTKIEKKDGSFDFASTEPKVFILPMYLFWIFSLSKLIVIIYKYKFTEDFIIKVIILSVIFIGSIWAWFKFKKTSPKSWNFWIMVFALSYVFINIYWEYFLPFLKSYIKTWNCILQTIVG
ncbi:MAG: hypothetical protein M0P02_03835 [Sulfurospirillaceae bacterium]|nr:hypothetical protein [Sulfurospirillaceae bacterium]MCK9546170.1 hypothetical protein [Sulfurospirillaceae bacterium]